MRKIKLLWDFRGPEGLRTAEHHVIHLKEFCVAQHITDYESDSTLLSEFHAIAYLIVDESLMQSLRESLKPHRGQWA